MTKIKIGIIRIFQRPELILYISWIIFAVAHCFFPINLNDDAWFAQILAGDKATFSNWLDFLIGRYYEWSSRSLIEGLLILFTRYPILWRIGDTLICISITVLIARLFNPERSRIKYWIMVICVFLFPISVIYEVGYIATSLNYSWPFAAALFALTPTIKHFLGRTVSRWEYIVAFPMMLLAGFQELICATSVLALVACFVYRLVTEKKLPKFELGMLVVAAIMLLYALSCPGNANRSVLETATWFPQYADLSLITKIELGFSSMIQMIFLKENSFVILFSAVITISVVLQSYKWWQWVIAIYPTAFILLFGTYGEAFAGDVAFVAWLRDSVGVLGTEPQLSSPVSWIPLILFASVLVALLLSLRFAIKNTKQYCFIFTVLALGAASRMAMGLSPTVWASGERIFSFLYASMAVVLGGLFYEWVLFAKTQILTAKKNS